VGSAADPIGASPTRIRGCGEDRGEVSSEKQEASFTNLEDISRESPRADCGNRFLHCPHDIIRILYCFIILLHDRRKVVHFNVTAHPTAVWTAQQMIEAFPEDTAPRYLLRDRDQIYGEGFRLRVKGMQIEEVITAPQSPFQNPYAERLIGSIRRECLDHLIIINEEHLRRILREYRDYYHHSRPHQSLERNSPTPREIELPPKGKVISIPQVGGLHHLYRRAA
jgi:putative transposase